MDDLISRSALLERIDDIYDCCDMTFDGERDHACKPEYCKGCKWYDTKQYIRKMVQNAPAVDAVVLPCKVGDTVYKIPSETNHKLNIISGKPELNRVYEQRVCRIELYDECVYMPVTCDGMDAVHSNFFGVNWFLTREEAEAALKRRADDAKAD